MQINPRACWCVPIVQKSRYTLGRVKPWSSKLSLGSISNLTCSSCLLTLASFLDTICLVFKTWLSCIENLISEKTQQIKQWFMFTKCLALFLLRKKENCRKHSQNAWRKHPSHSSLPASQHKRASCCSAKYPGNCCLVRTNARDKQNKMQAANITRMQEQDPKTS